MDCHEGLFATRLTPHVSLLSSSTSFPQIAVPATSGEAGIEVMWCVGPGDV